MLRLPVRILVPAAVFILSAGGCGHRRHRLDPIPNTISLQLTDAWRASVVILTDSRFERIFGFIPPAGLARGDDPESTRQDEPRQILQRIREALEVYSEEHPELAACRWRRPHSATVAFDGATEGPIQLICRRWSTRSSAEWSGTFAHEIAHRAGYKHHGAYREGNQCSVPYVVGDLVQTLLGEAQPDDICPVLRQAIAQETP